MTPLTAAIEALEKATEGSDILNTLIAEAVGDDLYALTRPYTTSLDAALTLVPEGWAWFVERIGKPFSDGRARLWVPAQWGTGRSVESVNCEAQTPALSVCLASLRARQQGSE